MDLKSREPAHTISESLLADYLKSAAVSELVVVEHETDVYRVEALLTWRTGRSVLVAARGSVRLFRSLNTVKRLFCDLGIGRTNIRMELLT